MPTTPYMSLLLPTVSSTLGPEWASELNNALGYVDAHNHSSGQGIQIPTAGLNINADLPFNGFNAFGLRSSRFADQPSALALAADLSCLYSSGGNLYWNSGSGVAVQITAGGALNAASIGAIGGDYATSGASEFYTSASKLFSFTSAANTYANLATGKVTVYEPTLGVTKGVTLQSPAALASAYALTLPAALPGATSLVTMDAAGILATTTSPTLSALTLTGNLALTAAAIQSIVKTAGTLRIGTGDNNDVVLYRNGVDAFVATATTLDAKGRKLAAVGPPTVGTDAATKDYVDSGQGATTFTGKPIAPATVAGDGATTLTTKGYVDAGSFYPAALRTVAVANAGGGGSGFGAGSFGFTSSTRTGTGAYQLTPSVALTGTGVPIATPQQANTIVWALMSGGTVLVRVTNLSGVATDGAFYLALLQGS